MDQSSGPHRSTLKFSYDGKPGPIIVSPSNQQATFKSTFENPKNEIPITTSKIISNKIS